MSNYAFIPLGKKANNVFAKVDQELYEYLSQWKWHLANTGYARRTEATTKRCIYMHRVVNSTPKSLQTDHLNGDKLDNSRQNLRSCTPSQNRMNRNNRLGKNSIFRGVSWSKASQKWQVNIQSNGKHYYLGVFNDPIEGAKIYNSKAQELHGEFARLNKIVA